MHHHRLFNDKSEIYEKARPTYPAELFNLLSNLTPSNELEWDCACGNGQATIGLIDKFDSIYATDISEEQIKNSKMHPKINYKVAPSEKCELPNESCDLICVAQALHWFDYDTFWPEALRVLKPGGIFSAWGYNWPVLGGDLGTKFNKFILDVVEPYWASQNKIIWNHFREINFPFEPITFSKPPMEVSWNLVEFLDFIYTFSATRRCIEDVGDDFFKLACSEISKVWEAPEKRKSIAFDFVLYIGRKETQIE
ncbi:class I SAM-dependent methyltransferase [Microbulbifer epialgicus]|uniref:Class I SAM-dependent methyltransferase n=1 Tax=Microbulbifer epialgicus TaxID=393907 RepID=A0ABV4P7Y1_9GAMM